MRSPPPFPAQIGISPSTVPLFTLDDISAPGADTSAEISKSSPLTRYIEGANFTSVPVFTPANVSEATITPPVLQKIVTVVLHGAPSSSPTASVIHGREKPSLYSTVKESILG